MSTIDISKMNLSKISDLIAKNNGESNLLHNRIRELSNQNRYLSEVKENRLMELFTEYIELSTKLDITSYITFTGIQTGVKKGDKSHRPSFSPGDVIEISKKNKKSVVITCITKTHTIFESGVITKRNTTNPNWTFRIDLDSLYHYLTRITKFKQGFDSYVKRTEQLDSLGIII